MNTENRHTVTATQVHGTVIQGRQYLTTEAICPTCGARNALAHVDSHYTMGKWYGCQHLRASNFDDGGLIETVEFSMTTTPTPLEWQPLWDAMDAAPTEWVETTSEMYWDMLECVPPRAQRRGAFLVGEAKTHNEHGQAVHACFNERADGRVFARHMTVAEFFKEFS